MSFSSRIASVPVSRNGATAAAVVTAENIFYIVHAPYLLFALFHAAQQLEYLLG